MRTHAPIGKLSASAYTIPTDSPEADGTMQWASTTLIVVEAQAGGLTGLGYTYTGGGITGLIQGKLAESVAGLDAMDPPSAWRAMQRAVRNMGREGLAATAISAVDVALFVDANGVKQALQLAETFVAHQDVRWLEEPVSSDDLDGLQFVRSHVPGRMEIAAGEYGYTLDYFRRILNAGAVDVQQAAYQTQGARE